MSGPEEILLIRLKSIGDVLFTLPAVHRVRDSFPPARIAFLVSQELAPLLSGFAEVNRVMTLNRGLFQQKRLKAACAHLIQITRQLRASRFSLVVDFQGYGETALLTWLARAPQRWGSIYRPSRRWAYTRGVARDNSLHPADWNLLLLETCGLPTTPVRNAFRLPENGVQQARAFFAERGCDPAKPTLYLQPFTSSPSKNWPIEKHLFLAKHWKSRGLQVIFGGGAAEREALAPASQAGFPVSAGVPLLTTAGLMKLSSLVVGGDTGVLHLAVALGRRVVMLIAATAPGSAHPYRHPEWALTPLASQSVADIRVEAAVERVAQALAELDPETPSHPGSPA